MAALVELVPVAARTVVQNRPELSFFARPCDVQSISSRDLLGRPYAWAT